MNRRNFLIKSKNMGLVGAAALVALPNLASGQTVPSVGTDEGKVKFTVNISNNHGHELLLSADVLLKLLKMTLTQPAVDISIQGQSSHAHTITLTEPEILKLISEERLLVNSSQDRGHTHALELVATNLS